MRYIIESQAIGDICHAPAGLSEQYFRFLYHPAGDDFRCGAARHFLQDFVEVVDVYGKTMCIVLRGAQT